MKGFVLAAGFGERLLPITETVPKPLLPVGNVPLIGYSLKLLAQHGIGDVTVNLHHLGKVIRDQLGDGERFGVRINYSEEKEILGTGGGIRKVRDWLEDGPVVVMNGDTIIDLDLSELVAIHRAKGALATLVLRQDSRQCEFGQLEVDEDGRIRRILGQGDSEGAWRPLMFAGVHILDPRILDYLPLDVNTCIIRYGYIKALNNNEPLFGVVADGYWNDAGTPDRYLQANFDALAQTMHLRHCDPLAGFALQPKRAVAEVVRMGAEVDLGSSVEIVPPVIIGDGARVGDHAVLGPVAVIGPRANVGKEAHVVGAVVLEGARVDPGVRIERCIVGKKAILPVKDATSRRSKRRGSRVT